MTALTRSLGARQLSRGLDSSWSDMDREAIRLWLSDHGEEIEDAHREVIRALVRFAGVVQITGAHEQRCFNIEDWMNERIDDASKGLAPEVREYLSGAGQ